MINEIVSMNAQKKFKDKDQLDFIIQFVVFHLRTKGDEKMLFNQIAKFKETNQIKYILLNLRLF